MRSTALATAAVLVFLGCSTGDPWSSAGQFDSSVFPIADDRFVVKYSGSPGMTSAVIREHLLYRAAELALQKGYGYFTFQGSNAQQSELASNALFSRGESTGLRLTPASRADVLDPCNPEAETGGGFTTLYSSTAVVRMLRAPQGSSRVFDANQVVAEFAAKYGTGARGEPLK